MTELITAILVGAGSRGTDAYGAYALDNPKRLKFVGVAEPRKEWRQNFARLHRIPPENVFNSWEEILAKEKFARAAFICTTDQMHVEPAILALNKGYDVLLEKPISNTLDGCLKVVRKAKECKNQTLQICHVLRYTNFWSKIKSFVDSGQLGKIISITHRENVGAWHMAHSFVRGIFRNSETSSPMILAKCCHDFDLLYWIVGKKPIRISSFGSLSHYTSANAPPGAPQRCTDGCPVAESCIYNAVKIYIDIEWLYNTGKHCPSRVFRFFSRHPKAVKALSHIIRPLKQLTDYKYWPVSVIVENRDYSLEGKMKALREGPYGRCVYYCDNNVVDHQQVLIEFENGVTAELTMHGHSAIEGRSIRIDGTKGTLIGFFTAWDDLVFYDSGSGEKKRLLKQKLALTAHGGGDTLLTEGFVNSLQLGFKTLPLTDAEASLESHLMAFAAEKARLEKRVIDMEEYHSLI